MSDIEQLGDSFDPTSGPNLTQDQMDQIRAIKEWAPKEEHTENMLIMKLLFAGATGAILSGAIISSLSDRLVICFPLAFFPAITMGALGLYLHHLNNIRTKGLEKE